MSKMKKVLLMCTAYVLVAALAIGGTIAYLQDSDSDVNVMTLGNVSIRQNEEQRVDPSKNGTLTEADIEDFEQAKPIYPYVDVNLNGAMRDDYEEITFPSGQKYKLFIGDNAIDKLVSVTNTGKTDAYVRTIVALEAPTDKIDLSVAADKGWTMDRAASSHSIEVDGIKYDLFVCVYNNPLKPGETTPYSLLQIILDGTATNEDAAAYGNTYDVLVLSQAIQTAGFADAATALNTGFGVVDADSAAEWFGGITVASKPGITEGGIYDLKGDVYTIDSAYFHTQKVAGETVTINGNGATVEGIATSVDAFQWEGGTIPAMSAIFSSADGSKVTVNNLKFTGTMSAIMLGHYVNSSSNWYNTEFNNVDIVNTEVVSFSAGISPAACVYGTAVLNNCNIYGTTLSKLDTDPMWPVYDLAAVNYSDLTVNNSKVGSLYMWNQAKVTVAAGTDVDTIVVRGNMNTTKYGLTIEAGANVGSIDLSAITNKARINITIEDGATVGKVIANGVEYATIADWQNA